MTIPFDITDPLAAINAWLLTALIRRFAPAEWSWLRPLTPILAVLMAVFIRAAFAAVTGEEVTWDTLLRALAAGSAAVLAHSQFRELVKVGAKRALEKEERSRSPKE